MPWVKGRYDIGITNNAGAIIGMMCAQRKDTPAYSEYDEEYLAEQQTTGVPGYENLPPEKEVAIRLEDFSGGLSREIYDPREPYKYFKAKNMDCRFGEPI